MGCERGFKRNQSRSAISGIVVSSPHHGGIVLLSWKDEDAPRRTKLFAIARRSCVLDAGVYSASSRAGKTRRAWLSRLFPFIFVYESHARRSDNCRGSCKLAKLQSAVVFSPRIICKSLKFGNFSNSCE